MITVADDEIVELAFIVMALPELPILELPLSANVPAILTLELVIAVRPLAKVIEPPELPNASEPVLAMVVALSTVLVAPDRLKLYVPVPLVNPLSATLPVRLTLPVWPFAIATFIFEPVETGAEELVQLGLLIKVPLAATAPVTPLAAVEPDPSLKL